MFDRLKSLKPKVDLNNRQVKGTDKIFEQINAESVKAKDMTFEQMKARIAQMQDEIKPLVDAIPQSQKISVRKVERTKGLPSDEKKIHDKLMQFLPEVYAFMKEIYSRKLGFTYHDVQLRAGIILAQGQRLVEQYTGEGKTMTFQLPLVLYSIVGRGAHLVTVNDYLSRRDGEYIGHIASELGLTVGIVTSNENYKFIADDQIQMYKGDEGVQKRKEMKSIDVSEMDAQNLIAVAKRESYNCDITYGTNNEFGFDYLRDNMAWNLADLVQRELYFCIIDEADSILIDEARTPLIISGMPSDSDTNKYRNFAEAVKDLAEDVDYEMDHKTHSVALTEEGITHVEKNLGTENLWKDYSMAYHIENALKALTMFKKDDQYMVRNGEVLIVDEFTGRVLKGRRYSEGLHQAIEAKEGVEIQQESKTYATITFQNFFRLYKILCGGSGTVMTEAEEFYKIYGLESVVIPTNRPVIRQDFPDRIYKTQIGKFNAVVQDIIENNKIGRPVLVGTTSVEKSELLSKLLDEAGISHEVLNAKYHEQEAKIIAQAGRKGAVTVATNMAGRGADIVIGGGRRGDDAWKEVGDFGGLYVIGTERHEARRIDNQLRGRTGRQGEPGSSRFYVALDDQLMKVLGGEIMTRLMNMVGLKDDMPIELGMISRQIETAQKRIEGMNFDSRKNIVEYDDVMSQHREIFYARRKDFLTAGEEAQGIFSELTGIIDIKLEQFKDKKSEYEKRIEDARLRLKELVRATLASQFVSIAADFYNKNRKTTDKNVEELIKIIKEYIPEYILVDVFKVSSIDLNKKLAERFIALKDQNALEEDLQKLLNESYENKFSEFGEDFYYVAKLIFLQNMDNLWVEHLELMKDIKEGIRLQAYAQKDPLVEYKNESFMIFNSFINNVDSEVAKKFLMVQRVERQSAIPQPEAALQNLQTNAAEVTDILEGDREFIDAESQDLPNETSKAIKFDSMVKQAMKQRKVQEASISTNASNSTGSKSASAEMFKNVGRNDPCPCGSGKKFKKCHGKNL